MDRRTDEEETIVAEPAAGKLAGVRKGSILAFRGIPFAKPPAGRLRWRMAEPCPPWIGVRDASRYAPSCPQAVSQIEALTGGMLGEQSEDCLYLNVWTPGCDGAKRPVMVWIHGGAFAIGAGSQSTYDGRHLASRDVVVVTINYRLGAFGFLALRDTAGANELGTGAEGLGDQILALDWVKANIAAFGGDPDNVTIFGESAGGMSVNALLASPAARGLFHKAIPQSGAGHIGHDRDRSARVTRALLDTLGLDSADAARLQALPADAILKAQVSLLSAARGGRDPRKLGALAFQPTIDGTILPERPIDAIRKGAANGIPVLTGTTREEWKLFTAADPRLRFMSAKGLTQRVTHIAHEFAPAFLDAYGEGSPFERFNAYMTDKNFTIPMIRLADAQSRTAPVHVYRFDWRSPLLGGIMGSCHALELGFVFGTHGQRLANAFFGSGPVAESLSSAMMDCWAAFARTGNPSTAASGTWPVYGESRDTMIFGDGAPHVASVPSPERLRPWDDFPERKLGP
ncbi:MAG: carboxylesterase/lipase family protein [Rhizomicrobium sp.]|jgi:para-nitrobenzyl esterase